MVRGVLLLGLDSQVEYVDDVCMDDNARELDCDYGVVLVV